MSSWKGDALRRVEQGEPYQGVRCLGKARRREVRLAMDHAAWTAHGINTVMLAAEGPAQRRSCCNNDL